MFSKTKPTDPGSLPSLTDDAASAQQSTRRRSWIDFTRHGEEKGETKSTSMDEGKEQTTQSPVESLPSITGSPTHQSGLKKKRKSKAKSKAKSKGKGKVKAKAKSTRRQSQLQTALPPSSLALPEMGSNGRIVSPPGTLRGRSRSPARRLRSRSRSKSRAGGVEKHKSVKVVFHSKRGTEHTSHSQSPSRLSGRGQLEGGAPPQTRQHNSPAAAAAAAHHRRRRSFGTPTATSSSTIDSRSMSRPGTAGSHRSTSRSREHASLSRRNSTSSVHNRRPGTADSNHHRNRSTSRDVFHIRNGTGTGTGSSGRSGSGSGSGHEKATGSNQASLVDLPQLGLLAGTAASPNRANGNGSAANSGARFAKLVKLGRKNRRASTGGINSKGGITLSLWRQDVGESTKASGNKPKATKGDRASLLQDLPDLIRMQRNPTR